MKFYQTRLKNGLTLIGEQRESAVSTAIGFFVRTGARDESAEILGVSHFLEHMMFKGTAKRSALEITFAFGDIGAQSNAYTTEENTVYYAAVLPEYFPRAMELLCDMLRPALDEHEFETEKKVILEEIALYQDRPVHVLFEAALSAYFQGHPAGQPVLGTAATVGPLTRAQMKNYFDARYSPGNIILAVAGSFRWEEFVDLATQYCGSWREEQCSRVIAPHQPKPQTIVLTRENLQRAHVALMTPGPSATDDARYPANVLATIMGDSSGSRTFWELIDKGLADAASIDADELEGTGVVVGYASADPERIAEVEGIVSEIMKSPRNFREADVDRAKTKLATSLVLQAESTLRRLMSMGTDWLYQNQYLPLEEELSRIKRVQKEDILQMLEQYSFEPVTSVKMIPA